MQTEDYFVEFSIPARGNAECRYTVYGDATAARRVWQGHGQPGDALYRGEWRGLAKIDG